MTTELAIILAEIEVIKIRVEGMKADNQARESEGNAPVYTGADFNYEAERMSDLVSRLHNMN